jgi:NADP-dependent 3-hydroxy acid dehydrogenase YdfG
MKPLTAKDIAEAVFWCVDRPAHVNVQSLVLYPTDQASPTVVHRKV